MVGEKNAEKKIKEWDWKDFKWSSDGDWYKDGD